MGRLLSYCWSGFRSLWHDMLFGDWLIGLRAYDVFIARVVDVRVEYWGLRTSGWLNEDCKQINVVSKVKDIVID